MCERRWRGGEFDEERNGVGAVTVDGRMIAEGRMRANGGMTTDGSKRGNGGR